MASPMVTRLQVIRARMVRLGLSERRFAKLLGISQSTLNARLNGYRPVPAGFEEQAAQKLDLWERAERAAAAVLEGRT